MLLMLSGDIESNPGPMSKTESEAFAAAMSTIQKLEEGHAALSVQLSETIEKLTASTNEVARLTEGILALESSVTSRSATDTVPVRSLLYTYELAVVYKGFHLSTVRWLIVPG
ncbi:hypothetical protein HPB50_026446 [Hyalomma asiaticum]|uniref:Uncharacterized protein n=1 Tax=Hyalomma asiaticum TaxID=266040 RepID=A0ACB7T009_HYAAI|nr:hypothetical protein HPB50_026446 [Hyalomma asiaticum]